MNYLQAIKQHIYPQPAPVQDWTQDQLGKARLERRAIASRRITGISCILTSYSCGVFSRVATSPFLKVAIVCSGLFMVFLSMCTSSAAKKFTLKNRGITMQKLSEYNTKSCLALTKAIAKTSATHPIFAVCEEVNHSNPLAVNYKEPFIQTYIKGVDTAHVVKLLQASQKANVFLDFVDLKESNLAHTIAVQFANTLTPEKVKESRDKVNFQINLLSSHLKNSEEPYIYWQKDSSQPVFRGRPTIYFWDEKRVILRQPPISQLMGESSAAFLVKPDHTIATIKVQGVEYSQANPPEVEDIRFKFFAERLQKMQPSWWLFLWAGLFGPRTVRDLPAAILPMR